MENLLSTYKCIYEKSTLWDYYEERHHKQFDINEIFSKAFIKKYFKDGCKESVFNISKQFPKERISHTVSTFFLGIFIKSSFSSFDIKNFEPDFRYLWFLICLFHDVGYEYESNKDKYSIDKYTLTHFKRSKKIICDNWLINSWHPQAIPIEFDLNTIQQYYEFCRKEKNFVNHGFIGGLLLFNKLLKNFQDIKLKANKNERKIWFDKCLENSFEFGNLCWSEADKEFYQQASEVILAHNIWFCAEKEDRKLYEDYKLDNLIIIGHPEKRISLEKSPLLFLLALADTIEPLKAFPDIKSECLLEKIKIIKIEKGFQIEILDDCLDNDKWFKNICEMQEWLKISVRKINGGKDTLQLNVITEGDEKNKINC